MAVVGALTHQLQLSPAVTILPSTQLKEGDVHVHQERQATEVSGGIVYSKSGRVVGRINGKKVFGTDGRYVGTIEGDRLVYRSTDSAQIGSSFSAGNRAGTARANSSGSAIWGDEPNIPD